MITDRLLSLLTSRVFPQYILDEYPQFVNFAKALFRYMEQHKHGYDIIANLLVYNDVDTTLDEFGALFKEQFASNFPAVLSADIDLIVKNIRSFYKNKGTESSYQFLFASIFGSDSSLKYPKQNIIKYSDGWWFIPDILVLKDEDGNIPPLIGGNGGTYYHLSGTVGKYFTGVKSGAVATVISSKQMDYPVDGWVGGDYYELKWVIEVDEEEGEFIPGEMIISVSNYIENGSFVEGSNSWTFFKGYSGTEAESDALHFYESDSQFTIVQDDDLEHDNYIYQQVSITKDTDYKLKFSVTNWDGNLTQGDFRVRIGYAPNTGEIYDSNNDANVNTLLSGTFVSEVDHFVNIPTIKVNVPVYVTVYANRGLGETITFDGLALIDNHDTTSPYFFIAEPNKITSATIASTGGSGYALDDIILVDNGVDEPAQLKVTELNQEIATVDIDLANATAQIVDGSDVVTVVGAERWADDVMKGSELTISGSTADDGNYTIVSNTGQEITIDSSLNNTESCFATTNTNTTGVGYAINDIINVYGGTVSGGDAAQLRVTDVQYILEDAEPASRGSGYIVGDELTLAVDGISPQIRVNQLSSAANSAVVNNGGSGYTVSDVLVANAGVGDKPELTVASVQDVFDSSIPVTVVSGGSGYTVGDIVEHSDANGDVQFTVVAENAGAIQTLAYASGGEYVDGNSPANPITLSRVTGGGSGATIEASFLSGSVATVTVSTAGELTSTASNPVPVTGGTGAGATFDITYETGRIFALSIIAAGATTLTLNPGDPASLIGGTGTGGSATLTWDSSAIATVSIENAGTYIVPPTNPVTVEGGAVFFMTWQDSDSVKTVDIVHPGLLKTQVATPFTDVGGAEFDLVYEYAGIIEEEGRWIDQRGWVSEPTMKIRDNYYYQEYSYDITSEVSVDRYRSIVKDNIHPAGLVMFSTIQENESKWRIDQPLIDIGDPTDVTFSNNSNIGVISATGSTFTNLSKGMQIEVFDSDYPDNIGIYTIVSIGNDTTISVDRSFDTIGVDTTEGGLRAWAAMRVVDTAFSLQRPPGIDSGSMSYLGNIYSDVFFQPTDTLIDVDEVLTSFGWMDRPDDIDSPITDTIDVRVLVLDPDTVEPSITDTIDVGVLVLDSDTVEPSITESTSTLDKFSDVSDDIGATSLLTEASSVTPI